MAQVMVDAYVIDTLMRDLLQHDKTPSSFVVYLYLWRKTLGVEKASVKRSHQLLADATGLSKSAVQSAVRRLVKRKLVRMEKASATAIPEYFVNRTWKT